MKKWKISKLDVKSAFLQTGNAHRDVYVRPLRESTDRFKCLWLLLTASYGMVNANAKFQVQSEELLLSIGLKKVIEITHIFYAKCNGALSIMLAKIIDDILISGSHEVVDDIIQRFNSKFQLGTIVQAALFWFQYRTT